MPQINTCRKCGAPILPVIGKGLVTYMFGQTLGIKPRRKTSALANYLCPRCAFYLSLRPSIEETDFFNHSAHQIIRNLYGTERPETQEAFARIFEKMIEREGRISEGEILTLTEPEIISPRRLAS
jgi:hypothetical protein